jgi:hypothetical protein
LGLLLFFLSFQAALKASQTIKKENKAFKEKKEAFALNSKNTLTSVTMNKSLDNSKVANETNEGHKKLAIQRRILSERQVPREPK